MNWWWREAGWSGEVEESTERRKVRKLPKWSHWEEGKGQQHRGGLAWAFTVAGRKAEETEPRVLCCACSVAQSRPACCNPMDCSLPGSSVHGDSPGKNTGMGSLSLLQEIFPIQESNRGLLHHTDYLPAELPGKPGMKDMCDLFNSHSVPRHSKEFHTSQSLESTHHHHEAGITISSFYRRNSATTLQVTRPRSHN